MRYKDMRIQYAMLEKMEIMEQTNELLDKPYSE
jgi:hypothetical protein